MKIALRNLARHKSATFRIIICLTAVFLLATVGIAGGIIADQTTKDWIEKATGKDAILIAHQDMYNQYERLVTKFSEAKETTQFNYTDGKYLVSEAMLNHLGNMSEVTKIDARLVLEMNVTEIPGIIYNEDTGEYTTVGDHHTGKSLIIGVDPEKMITSWFLAGEFLKGNSMLQALIGDSLAQQMFASPLNQSVMVDTVSFDIVGVCVDPLNNGNLTYMHITDLEIVAKVSMPNIAMAQIAASGNRSLVLSQLGTEIKRMNPEFDAFDLNEALDKNLAYVGFIWSTIMFLPVFSLFAAFLCLTAYVVLTINEQRQEFGVLRALGGKPATVVRIISIQNLVVLLSSFAAGTAFGIIITLLILIPGPIITASTTISIAGWLLVALAVTFMLSLYPALRFARKPVLEIMTQT